MKRKVDILHVLPHAGGGVGTVLMALLAADTAADAPYRHRIAALEYLHDAIKRHCTDRGIGWIDEIAGIRHKDLCSLCDDADIVLVHWWNHPLLMRLLFHGLPATRLILWSHVNGFHPPQAFFSELFELPDRFVFSSSVSLTAPAVLALSDRFKSRLRVVRSCGGIPAGSACLPSKPRRFQAGYIGTVESMKMHPDFLTMCADAVLPTPVVVAGGPAHEALREKAEAMMLADFFEILGPVADPATIFRRLHAFAYPLNPRHYGTGEQVLIEAMAFGAVPVVLANPPESALIRDGRTGLVAEDTAAFSAALRMLADNAAERDKLAAEGHRFVMEECGTEHSSRAFHALFEETLALPKQPRKLQLKPVEGVYFGSPLHLFLASLGDTEERRCFDAARWHGEFNGLPGAFASKTRGTSFHYRDMLGEDAELASLCDALVSWRN